MPSSNLIRLGGLAAITAGVLLVIGELLYLIAGFRLNAETLTTTSHIFQSFLFLLGHILLLGGLVGLYVGRAGTLGGLGLAGFLAAFLGTALSVVATGIDALIVPALAEEAPELLSSAPSPLAFVFLIVSGVLFSLGWLLLGLAALRTRAYPRWAAMLLMVGSVLTFVKLPFTFVPLSVAVAWMGLSLLSGRSSEIGTAAPSREATDGRARVR